MTFKSKSKSKNSLSYEEILAIRANKIDPAFNKRKRDLNDLEKKGRALLTKLFNAKTENDRRYLFSKINEYTDKLENKYRFLNEANQIVIDKDL
jgi:hypothetical protein